jgi:hypothetical protein
MTVDGVKKTTLSSQELVKLIRRAAEQGDFRKAEALRETLMQTDSLAAQSNRLNRRDHRSGEDETD